MESNGAAIGYGKTRVTNTLIPFGKRLIIMGALAFSLAHLRLRKTRKYCKSL